LLFSFHGFCACAQPNVHYDGVENPYLFLLREPAIYDELRLTDAQKKSLLAVNERFDGPLLALRIKPPDEARQELARIYDETQRETQQLLSASQQQRLSQILLRLRGAECLLNDKVASGLEMSAAQRKQIESHVQEAGEALKKLADRAQSEGKRAEHEQEYQRLRRREHEQLLAVLAPSQKSQLGKLLGAGFDRARLGRVGFKAPELRASDTWLNSSPLRLADLKGEVIALHYFTYG
jgi:hypothetical protein